MISQEQELLTRVARARPNRKTITDLYQRICADGRYSMDADKAMRLTADVLGVHPLEVGYAMPSIDVAEKIARGELPVRASLSKGEE